jgi:GxxExxY protein
MRSDSVGGMHNSPPPPLLVSLMTRVLSHAIEVHDALGPWLAAPAYRTVLHRVLTEAGHRVERAPVFDLQFGGRTIERIARADLLIDDALVVELLATAFVPDDGARSRLLHARRQRLQMCLQAMPSRYGLVLDFGHDRAIEGFERVENLHLATVPDSLRNGRHDATDLPASSAAAACGTSSAPQRPASTVPADSRFGIASLPVVPVEPRGPLPRALIM